ncbi:MAG: tol-pal system protein YbgF [bacterium]
MKKWMVLCGFLMIAPLLSSCATRQGLLDLQRQLQTTRGELSAVRKEAKEVKSVTEQLRSADNEQRESYSRMTEQIKALLDTIEAQQKAIASSNSSVQERLSAMEAKNEERLKTFEERKKDQEKGYLASQGNLGTRLEELATEVKIIQGKLEENNNLLAEHGMRFDDLSHQASRSGGKVETTEANLKAIKGAQSSQAEKLNRVEGQVASLVKNWEAWREQANRSLSQMGDLERRLGSLEQEMGRIKEAYRQPSMTPPPQASKEAKAASPTEPPLPAEPKEPTGSKGAVAPAPPPGGDEIYKSALDDYNRGAYDLAIPGFRSYLSQYPKGSLAANSQYWLGECYYSQKKYEQAIAEFEGVLRNYPASEKAPSALLKKGYSYLGLGNMAKGKEILMEVLDKYPKTREASLAKSRLANLK